MAYDAIANEPEFLFFSYRCQLHTIVKRTLATLLTAAKPVTYDTAGSLW